MASASTLFSCNDAGFDGVDFPALAAVDGEMRELPALLDAATIDECRAGIALVDRFGDIVLWNRAAARMTRLEAAIAVGGNLVDILSPAAEDVFIARIEASETDGNAFDAIALLAGRPTRLRVRLSRAACNDRLWVIFQQDDYRAV